MSLRFHFGRPQQIAAFLLLLFLAEALFVIGRTPLRESDYRYALCGREMWEKPSPALGYFTTCGNMQGDGSLAYRAAGLPLSADLAALRILDTVQQRLDSRKPAAQRTYISNPVTGSTYELRHQISGTRYLLRVPFAIAATLLGAGLWWVSRRLFGNLGGFFALGLYVFSPEVLRYATQPNNEILAAWGLYAVIYTAIGIAHAMYGPRRKWRPRIVLFTVALGLTACSHVLAAVFGVVASTLFMLYVAQHRRLAVLPIVIASSLGALFIVFASYTFRLSTFFYVFTAGSARFTFSRVPLQQWIHDPQQLAAYVAVAVALVLYVAMRRSRYFGNTTPVLAAICLLPLATTEVLTVPVFWAWPFVLTFTAGVFADALETGYRKLFLALTGTVLLAQAVLCITALPGLNL